MERVKRRWWTWAISAVAATVIAGAALSGAFQVAVLLAPGYRENLADWVTQATGRPVQIDGVSLSWRGLAPRFDLNGLTLFSEDGQDDLSVERLSLGMGLRNLLRGSWMPSRLELAGLRMSAEVDEDGQLRIGGFSNPAVGRRKRGRESWVDQLERFEWVVLEDCELRLQHPLLGDQPSVLRLQRLDIEKTEQGFASVAQLRLPPDRGGEVVLSAQIDGPVARPHQWHGQLELNLNDVQPQGWLRAWLLPGTQVITADLSGLITGEISAGELMNARAMFHSGGVVLAQAGVLASARRSSFTADYLRTAQGWRIDLKDLSLEGQSVASGMVRRTRSDGDTAYDIEADHLDLARLAPWSGVWQVSSSPALGVLQRLHGDVQGLVLRYGVRENTAHYALRARLQQVGLDLPGRLTLRGLSGDLSADENGGLLQLAQTAEQASLHVELPQVLDAPLVVQTLTAPLRWQRQAQGWQIQADPFVLALASVRAQGRLDLLLPDVQGASPVIDLNATLSADDLREVKPYIPRFWSEGLRHWLDHGIVAGRVARGALTLRGPLADYPFVKNPVGEWKLTLDVADATLDYAEGWPPLEDLRARVTLARHGLSVVAEQGRLRRSRLRRAQADIADFDDHQLTVQASVDGALPDHYALLRDSPLHEPLHVLLDKTEAQGDARVELKLNLPLHDAHHPQFSGQVVLDGAALRYGTLLPLEDLRGTLQFNAHGVTAQALSGRYADVPMALWVEQAEDTLGLLKGRFDFAPDVGGRGLSAYLPRLLRPWLQGSSNWTLALPLRAEQVGLTLRSDLAGTRIDLPEPLGKPAAQPAPLQVRISSDEQADVRIALDYDSRFAANIGLLPQADAGAGDGAVRLRVDAMRARLNVNQVPIAEPGKVIFAGRVETLDVPRWLEVLLHAGDDDPARVDPGDDDDFHIDSAAIEAERVVWGAFSLPPTQLLYQPDPGGWRIDVSGQGGQGQLQWRRGVRAQLRAQLERLTLNPLAAAPAISVAPAVAAAAAPAQPGHWPQLDLEVAALSMGRVTLGRARLFAKAVTDGLSFDQIVIEGGDATLAASGHWQRRGQQSLGDLQFQIDSPHVGALLSAFGYAQNVDAQASHIRADLRWPAATQGLQWEDAVGDLDLRFEQGVLRAVKPGATRALGLISFFTLPRRLSLNFDDVVGEGLAFDRVTGHFTLGDGRAITENLKLEGPSLQMDVRGSVGLRARDYDQWVNVHPSISSGVTLGAALLGGPAVGALVLMAQELLNKPLEQVTQFSYRVTGPWDSPQVSRAE